MSQVSLGSLDLDDLLLGRFPLRQLLRLGDSFADFDVRWRRLSLTMQVSRTQVGQRGTRQGDDFNV
jgi:hypothetical protein